jgi:hypothetical protein
LFSKLLHCSWRIFWMITAPAEEDSFRAMIDLLVRYRITWEMSSVSVGSPSLCATDISSKLLTLYLPSLLWVVTPISMAFLLYKVSLSLYAAQGWPQTHNPLTSTSWVPGLQAQTTMPSQLYKYKYHQ